MVGGTDGTGIGLAIVRDCMANMGGSVSVASVEGYCTQLTLVRPEHPQPSAIEPRE